MTLAEKIAKEREDMLNMADMKFDSGLFLSEIGDLFKFSKEVNEIFFIKEDFRNYYDFSTQRKYGFLDEYWMDNFYLKAKENYDSVLKNKSSRYVIKKSVELGAYNKIMMDDTLSREDAFDLMPYALFWAIHDNGRIRKDTPTKSPSGGKLRSMIVDRRFFVNAMALLQMNGFVVKKVNENMFSCSLP